MRRRLITFIACAALAGAASVIPDHVHAQGLADRIAAAPANATVVFRFEGRPGICGDGERIIMQRADGRTTVRGSRGSSYYTRDGRARDYDIENCVEGPVEMRLDRRGGRIHDADMRVGGAPLSGVMDLGTVSPAAAIAWLLSPPAASSQDAVERMIFAATLAAAESWPGLLRLAKDRSLDSRPRSTAIFWLSQAAGDKATEGLVSLIGDDSDELEVRKQAVFALSQQKGDTAIDALIEVARTNREPEIRKNAIFWLGQTASPRAIAFFEQILGG